MQRDFGHTGAVLHVEGVAARSVHIFVIRRTLFIQLEEDQTRVLTKAYQLISFFLFGVRQNKLFFQTKTGKIKISVSKYKNKLFAKAEIWE